MGDVRKKAQAIQKENTTTYVLSRGSYDFPEKKLIKDKKKKRLEEVAQSKSTNTIIDPPSPIRRHVKWNMARTKKSVQMTSQEAKKIVDRIVSDSYLIPLKSRPHREALSSMDIKILLTATIGRPEHPGRVRVVGAGVTIKQYFGPASRSS
ncbi:hypothetical protein HKD37_06G016598 [Glycine soja]